MTENRFKTDLPEMMVGFYTAENVLRKWTEDFVDSDTGTVTSVERSELILERGTYIDADVASSLSFYIQAGDIDGVLVTDVRRTARPYERSAYSPWKVTFAFGSKSVVLILYAKTLEDSVAIGREFVERNKTGYYDLLSVGTFKDCVIIEHDFTESECEDENGEPIVRNFYLLDTVTHWMETDLEQGQLFVVLAKDVDEARDLTLASIADRAHERAVQLAAEDRQDTDAYRQYTGDFDIRLISGSKIPCNDTVPVEFTKEWYEGREDKPQNV